MTYTEPGPGERHPSRRVREKASRKIDGRNYLFHFAKPLGSDKHSIQHYYGYTPRTVEARYTDHKAGRGARITQVLNEKGIDYWPVMDTPGNRDIENNIKAGGSLKPLCPECTPNPKVPKIIQQAIKREERSRKYYQRKERAQNKMRELMARPVTPGEKVKLGAEAASNWVKGQLNNGKSLAVIESSAENFAAADKESDYQRGWDIQVESDLQMARELEKQDDLARAREEEAASVDTYRASLTALADREARVFEHPSWLPTAEELSAHPTYQEREAG